MVSSNSIKQSTLSKNLKRVNSVRMEKSNFTVKKKRKAENTNALNMDTDPNTDFLGPFPTRIIVL